MKNKIKRRRQGGPPNLLDPYVHGANLLQKEQHKKKYKDDESKRLLSEIRLEYNQWHNANVGLIGPTSTLASEDEEVINKRSQLFEVYKRFLDQEKYALKFDSRSNLHSSALEEFMYYLFRDLVKSFSEQALIGKSHTFKDLFFVPPRYSDMLKKPGGMIETKDHDFVIGATVWASLTSTHPDKDDVDDKLSSLVGESEPSRVSANTEQDTEENDTEATVSIQAPLVVTDYSELHRFDIPAVAIECKTYLDKTMLESSARAAEELKARNPNGIYIVVMERIKLTESVNLRKYKLDQIYVLRKQRNKDREDRLRETYGYKPIAPDVVWHLFTYVRDFLTRDWETGIDKGIERGFLF